MGDDDGTANRIIIDPSGLGIIEDSGNEGGDSGGGSSSGGGGGGGCFISTSEDSF